jgi:hypothetical protein
MNIPANLLSNIPIDKQAFLRNLVAYLSKIPNLLAVVLGGSYASGTQRPASDMDIGLYYSEAEPFSIEEIKNAAATISKPGSSWTVTGFYEWGAWVNGGAWIETEVGKVDFLYRNLDQVRAVIQEAHQGIFRHDYDQQPANGYYSVGYLAETQICLPLFDPASHIFTLKEQVRIYPPKLKQAIIQNSLWSAEFTLIHAHSFSQIGDIYNTTGCLIRIAANLTQALFAVNERYFMSDKKVIDTISSFDKLPDEYLDRVLKTLARPGSTPLDLSHSVENLDEAWRSVVSLVGEMYQPKFYN